MIRASEILYFYFVSWNDLVYKMVIYGHRRRVPLSEPERTKTKHSTRESECECRREPRVSINGSDCVISCRSSKISKHQTSTVPPRSDFYWARVWIGIRMEIKRSNKVSERTWEHSRNSHQVYAGTVGETRAKILRSLVLSKFFIETMRTVGHTDVACSETYWVLSLDDGKQNKFNSI